MSVTTNNAPAMTSPAVVTITINKWRALSAISAVVTPIEMVATGWLLISTRRRAS